MNREHSGTFQGNRMVRDEAQEAGRSQTTALPQAKQEGDEAERRNKRYLLVVIHVGDLSAVPLPEGVRGLHRPVDVINAVCFVIVSGKCKKYFHVFSEMLQGKWLVHYTLIHSIILQNFRYYERQ